MKQFFKRPDTYNAKELREMRLELRRIRQRMLRSVDRLVWYRSVAEPHSRTTLLLRKATGHLQEVQDCMEELVRIYERHHPNGRR